MRGDLRRIRSLVLGLTLAWSVNAAVAQISPKGSEITVESVLERMNGIREQNGLGPLSIDHRLTLAAGDRMRDMEELGFWGHTSPDGRSPFLWAKTRGYRFSVIGENLACGFETPEVLVDSWLESPGHRAVMLSPGFDDVGIAVIEGMTDRRGTGRSVVALFGREDLEPEWPGKKQHP